MSKKRRNFTASFKAKVALEAAKEIKSLKEIAAHYELAPSQVTEWKKQLISSLPSLFEKGKKKKADLEHSTELSQLYEQIGRLTMERDYLEKKIERYG